jgi:hypothetical protein
MKNEQLPAIEIKVKQPPVLFGKTQALIARLADRLGGPLVAYWNGPRGSVCHNDVVVLYHVLERLGQHEVIYVFLKSDGGSGQVSLRLVNLLRQRCRRLVALVPLECASAATMIALGADGILMGPTAYLTAVDTSLNHALSPVDRDNDRVSVSLNELQRVIRLWREQQGEVTENAYKSLFQYVHPLVIGAVDRAESLSIMLCRELQAYHIADEAKAEAISDGVERQVPVAQLPDPARRGGQDRSACRAHAGRCERLAGAAERLLQRDGPKGDDGLRRSACAQQRDRQHLGIGGCPGLLSTGQGLVLPCRGAALDHLERQQRLAPHRTRGQAHQAR